MDSVENPVREGEAVAACAPATGCLATGGPV